MTPKEIPVVVPDWWSTSEGRVREIIAANPEYAASLPEVRCAVYRLTASRGEVERLVIEGLSDEVLGKLFHAGMPWLEYTDGMRQSLLDSIEETKDA